jgi:hypothetical protein
MIRKPGVEYILPLLLLELRGNVLYFNRLPVV